MNPEGDHYGKRILDFVERLQQLTNYQDVCRHIMKELEWYGFSCVTCFSIPGPGAKLKDGILLNSRPAEYVEREILQGVAVGRTDEDPLSGPDFPVVWRRRREQEAA